jgi:hypothetical protein
MKARRVSDRCSQGVSPALYTGAKETETLRREKKKKRRQHVSEWHCTALVSPALYLPISLSYEKMTEVWEQQWHQGARGLHRNAERLALRPIRRGLPNRVPPC